MTTRTRFLGAVLALVLGAVPGLLAQDKDARAPRKIYTRTTVFRLPVQIDEAEQAGLKELKLFVKALPGDWVCNETAAPTQNSFSYRAPQDGEYWFAFATVDTAGRMSPATFDKEPPGLIVIVDTAAPEIEVCPLPASSQVYLQCKLHDANPDYRSVKVEYEAATSGMATFVALEPVPDTPGVFYVPDKKVLSGKLRVHAADKAGNAVDKIVELGTPKAAPQAAPVEVVATVSPIGEVPSMPLPGPTPGAEPTPTPATPLPLPATTTVEKSPVRPAALPVEPVPTVAPSAAQEIIPASATMPAREPAASTLRPAADKVPLVNSCRCRIEFSAEAVDGGVAKVEVWATSDNGKTWILQGESGNGKSPAQVEFPRDGLYGYSLVVRPNNGPAATPVSGDAPDGWIEIDTIKPAAEFGNAVLGAGTDAGHVLISWVAQDKNFGPEPISLYYAANTAGPWTLIADKVANTGAYRWVMPQGMGGKVFFRVQATDRAGNATVCDSPAPLALDGRPKVKVLSVSAVGKE